MLKQSLIVAVIVGGLATAAGAEGEVKVEETKRLEAVQPEFEFALPEATCQTVADEGQDAILDMITLEEETSSRIEAVEVAYRTRRSICYVCSWIGCFPVYC